MRMLNASGVEIDVSYLSNSDCYKLVEALAPYHSRVKITSDQRNKFALQREGVTKCYKQNPHQWAKNGWEQIVINETMTLALGRNDAPVEAPSEYMGVACDETAIAFLSPRPRYCVRVGGTYLWADDDLGLEFIRSIKVSDVLVEL